MSTFALRRGNIRNLSSQSMVIHKRQLASQRHNAPILLSRHVRDAGQLVSRPNSRLLPDSHTKSFITHLVCKRMLQVMFRAYCRKRESPSHRNGLIERYGGRPTLLYPSVIEAFIWIKDLRRSHCSRFKCFHYGAFLPLSISIYRRMGMSFLRQHAGKTCICIALDECYDVCSRL